MNGAALLYTVAILLVLLLAYFILRIIRAFKKALQVLALLVVPRFSGTTVISDTLQLTDGAPVKEFAARLQAEGEDIKRRLIKEKEIWAAGHITLLAPATSSLKPLVDSIPKVQSVDVSAWVKFFVAVMQTFSWSVQTGLAVFPPNDILAVAPPVSAGSPLPPLPAGGQLNAYAVLQWGWFVKNSWRRTVDIGNDRSAMSDLARELAELILGEAFV